MTEDNGQDLSPEAKKLDEFLTDKGVKDYEIQWSIMLMEQALATAKSVENIPLPVVKRSRQIYSYMNEFYIAEGLDMSAPRLNQKLVQALQDYRSRVVKIIEEEKENG